MQKIIFIVPYYGVFPDFFREWVFSAGYLAKQQIDFLLITDLQIDIELPENIHVLKLTFDELAKRIQSKFDFFIKLPSPYKLCDFRPAWGYIFEDEITGYDFWGNCDIDMIWGNVRNFITDEILSNYDRIQFLGHFTLYHNTPKINKIFMLPGAAFDYKKVFGDADHYSFCEHSGIMKIVVDNHISNYLAITYADISPRYSRMIISRQPNYDYQIIYWEDGRIYRSFIDKNGMIGRDEYMYCHFQKKYPSSLGCWKEKRIPERIIIHADKFIEDGAEAITEAYIRKHSDFTNPLIDKIENWNYLTNKMLSFIKSPYRIKKIWIKQRMSLHKVIRQEEYFGKNYKNV